MKKIYLLLFVLSMIGLLDSLYLTYEHFRDTLPPCEYGAFFDCGSVLRSEYASIGGIPLALIGVGHYLILAVVTAMAYLNKIFAQKITPWLVGLGALASIYFVYLQLVILRAICLYCMVSAVNSFIMAGLIVFFGFRKRKLSK